MEAVAEVTLAVLLRAHDFRVVLPLGAAVPLAQLPEEDMLQCRGRASSWWL